MRATVTVTGERAHSARSWRGVNAIHGAAEVLNRLSAYHPRQPVIDGLTYHEGLNAVAIKGGVAGNVIPDECVIQVNYRFAPDRSEEQAVKFVHEFFAPYQVKVTDLVGGALPGLDQPAAQALVQRVNGVVNPKFGWTDVARFAALGVPAINFGPGDPMYAHHRDEHVLSQQICDCLGNLTEWLTE
jgi:succinyl-diaminopimelate desuccinylase